MKRFAMVCLVAALSLCILPFAAQAQVRKDSVHTSIMGGGIFSNHDDLGNGGFYGLGLGYNLTENWGIEAFGAFAPLKTDDSAKFGNEEHNANFRTGRIDGLYHFDTGTAFVPYLAAGLGGVKYTVSGDTGDHDYSSMAVNGGVGFKYFFNDTIALRVDARDMYAFNRGANNYIMTTAGLTFQFGGNGPCADSDNDGVCDEYDACPGTPAGYKVDSRGCPIVQTIHMNIQFEFDKAVVREQFMPEVSRVAEFMKRNPKSDAVIEGHTDNRGTAVYNQKLSERRAHAVRDIMVNRYGISSSRLQAAGFGLSRPIATNDTEEGRYKNRRVVATVSGAEMEK